MRIKGTKTVKLSAIQTYMFVRDALDQNHVLYLVELMENGVEMKDLLEVVELEDGTIVLVDGRHRKEGYELNGIQEIKVKIVEFDDEAEMIAYAYCKNTGGSKPPTAADTEHTVKLLLERKESMKRIGELLGLPAGLARKYANEVRSRMNRAKLQRAAEAVTDGGLTVAKAAETHEVDLDKLKEILSTRKKQSGTNLKDLHRNLSRLYNGLGKKNASVVKKFMDKFEDGDVSEKQVREIISHIEDLQRRATRTIAEWRRRFDARVAAKKAEEKAAKVA